MTTLFSFSINRNPTIEQLGLPLRDALRHLPANLLQRFRQLWGPLDAICSLVPGRPVNQVVSTQVQIKYIVLLVHGALDALKRSTAFIRPFVL
jgi:hypothetical protein